MIVHRFRLFVGWFVVGLLGSAFSAVAQGQLLISSLNFEDVNAATYIDNDKRTVTVYVPYGTDRSALDAKIEHNAVSIRRSPETVVGFEAPVTLDLEGPDGEVASYTVDVTVHHWEAVNDAPGWKPRDGQGLLSFQGKLWMLGGWEAPKTTSQVWVSNDDGRSWERLPDAPWPGRHGAGWTVFKDRMWVLAGDDNSDVWSSADGIEWVEEVKSAPFGKRYTPYVVPFKGKLWLMGGTTWQAYPGVSAYNDVWSSEDGRTWKLELKNAPWAPRGLIHGHAVLRDRMYIMGGGIKTNVNPGVERGTQTVSEYKDVWYTTDGVKWVRAMDWAPWAARTHFSVTSTPKYIYVTDGSVRLQSKLSNEVWRTRNGHKWERVTPTPWSRRHASSLTYHNGRLVLASGYLVADVWAMDSE